MIFHNIEQRSEAWHDIRLGRITGTCFKSLVAKDSTAAYQDLITDIACEIITGRAEDSYTNEIMQHGIDTEPIARKEYENIFGVVTQRQGTNKLRAFNSRLFYVIAGFLTNGLVTKNASDFRLVDKKVYTAVRSMQERNRFVRGLFSWVGFKSLGVEMVRPPRFAGVSNAHTAKVLDLAMKGIFAHSYIPIRLISILGLTTSFVAVLLALWTVFSAVVVGVPFDGFGSLMVTLLLGFGILTLSLGIVGEYLALIYEEVKQRPNFVVSERIGFE
jgi:dolichol-phosphate mannosyltransferase